MLPIYQNAQDVTVSLDYPMDGASPVIVASVDCEVLDETGSIVSARTAVPGSALVDNVVTLTIDNSINVLPTGATRTLRTARFYFNRANGTYITADYRYVVEATARLVVMGNSFQTYETALMTRLDMPALDGWDMADERSQIAALITAHDRLCRLTFRYRLTQDKLEWGTLDPTSTRYLYNFVPDMRLRDTSDYAEWPADFKEALNKAQLYEADLTLSGDPIGDLRSAGVVSETTGEAKMFFSNRAPLRHPVGPKALEVLTPYLYRNNRLRRG